MSAPGNRLIKIFCLFLIASAIFLFLPEVVLARVVINEFSSSTNPDWVEIYRTQTENLSLYYLEDAAGNKKELSWDDCNGDFCVVDWSNKLNNLGDIIKLVLNPIQLIDQVAYGDMGDDVEAPETGQSAGRNTDGASSWAIFSNPTRGNTNNTAEPAPPSPTSTSTSTPIPTLSPVSSPTPTPSPTTATYKINEVKDEDGEVLSSVKVYVDNVYLHHYAPETLTFCDGCQCDTYVDCNFGQHEIKLERSGYQDWNESRIINPGNSYEVDPVMIAASSDSPTSTPTPTKTSTPASVSTSTPTPKPTGTTETLSPGEVLGEKEFYPLEATEEGEENREASSSEKSERKILPFIFLGLGFVFLFGAGFYFWYTKIRTTE